MFQRYGKRIMWIGLGLLILFIAASLYSMFGRPLGTPQKNSNVTMLLIGLGIGATFIILLWRIQKSANKASAIVSEHSHTIVESMKRIFKIVCAEGYISEVYNYKQSKKLLAFIPAQKSALVIVKAKVMIGFDIEKCRWEMDEENKKVRLISVPEPELLSIETDYNYYSLDDEIFYKFSNDDFRKIQENARKQVEKAAMESEMPRIAKDQLRTLLTEVIKSKDWKIEDNQQLLN